MASVCRGRRAVRRIAWRQSSVGGPGAADRKPFPLMDFRSLATGPGPLANVQVRVGLARSYSGLEHQFADHV